MPETFDLFTTVDLAARRQIHAQRRTGGCPVRVGDGVYFAATHADTARIARSPEDFRQGGFSLVEHRIPDDDKVLSELDAPLHSAVRRVFTRLITPKKMAAYRSLVEGCFEEVLVRVEETGQVELVSEIANVVPPRIIGMLAGLGPDMIERVGSYTADYHDARFERDAEAGARVASFDERIVAEIAQRRASPNGEGDWLSILLECVDHHNQPLSDERLATMFTKDLLVGGTITTSPVFGKMMFELVPTVGLWDRLRDDPELAAVAVEESLRLHPSLMWLLRRPVGPVVVGQTGMGPDDVVVLGLESANLDPTVFPEPTTFDLDRGSEARRHLSFGFGPHSCIGAPLARLELEVFLRAMLRFDRVELAPGFEPSYLPGPLSDHLARLDLVVG